MRRNLVILCALALAACGHPQSPLNPAGDEARALSGLWELMLWVCGATYLLVLVFLGWSLWRNRGALAAQARFDRRLGVGLKAWAIYVVIGLTVLGGASFLVQGALKTEVSRQALQVRVTGHQWWWRVQYRDPASGAWIETANEVHLPLGRPARIEVEAADVIHSFWIPTLSGKIDMIPGRTNAIPVTPRRTGWFRGQCAEFCGLEHAKMALDVKVEAPAAFDAWLAEQARPAAAPADPAAAQGLALVTGGTCAQCHTIRGSSAAGRAGPDLTHLASRRSLAAGTVPFGRGALMGWIAQPQAIKPGAEMPPSGLAPVEALTAVRFLEGLK